MSAVNILSDGSEQVQYNDMRYPLYASYGRLSMIPDMRFAYHWHDDWEFELVAENKMTYNVNGDIFTVNAGEGVFINSHQLHQNYSDDGTDAAYMCLLVNPDMITDKFDAIDTAVAMLINNSTLPYMVLRREVRWQDEVLERIGETFRLIINGDDNMLIGVYARIYAIVELFLRNAVSNEGNRSIDQRVPLLRQMTGFIQTHYRECITLGDIAKSGGVSNGSCISVFRRYTGMTPMRYVTEYRLKKACGLLKNPGLSITEIAYECGFTGSSYFAEVFGRRFGIAPREYRSSAMNYFNDVDT